MIKKTSQHIIDAAHRYAAADKSDPFALNRALAHVRNGIGTIVREDGREESHYDARPTKETRTLDAGTTFSDGTNQYAVTVYREVKRP